MVITMSLSIFPWLSSSYRDDIGYHIVIIILLTRVLALSYRFKDLVSECCRLSLGDKFVLFTRKICQIFDVRHNVFLEKLLLFVFKQFELEVSNSLRK